MPQIDVTDANLELFHKGLSKIWRLFDPDTETYYPQLQLKRMPSREALEDFLSAGDFPLPGVVAETAPLPEVSREFPFPQRVRPFKVGYMWSVSYEAEEDDYYAQMSASVPALRLAFDMGKEKIYADRWNNATSTSATYANPDGLPLASENHRLCGEGVGQGTASNLSFSPFNPASVEAMRSAMIMQESHRGNPFPAPGPYDLIIHPAFISAAERMMKSDHQAGTDQNDPNVIGRKINRLVWSPFFTMPFQFGLRQAQADRQPFCSIERSGDLLEIWRDRRRQLLHHSITSRYIPFEAGWRGLRVSKGAGN